MTKISKTWWGQKFIEALEDFTELGRLQRGRAYSSDKRILKFDIKNNIITATVRGNKNPYFGVYEEPKYKIKIELTKISADDWSKITKKLTKNTAWLSKLLLNEMPDNIEEAFYGMKIKPLPKAKKEFKVKCSCPDYASPCKHIAGVYYRVATMLDKDPFLLFQLRGLTHKDLQKQLSSSPLGKAFITQLSDINEVSVSKHRYTQPSKTKYPKEISIREFWGANTEIKTNTSANVHNIPALLIKKQGDYPQFWQRENSFLQAMEDIYTHVVKKNSTSL